MNAATMVAVCSSAQWQGLTPTERAWLDAQWDQPMLPTAPRLRAWSVPQIEHPIWTVAYGLGHALTLLSVKDDCWGDVPGVQP